MNGTYKNRKWSIVKSGGSHLLMLEGYSITYKMNAQATEKDVKRFIDHRFPELKSKRKKKEEK